MNDVDFRNTLCFEGIGCMRFFIQYSRVFSRAGHMLYVFTIYFLPYMTAMLPPTCEWSGVLMHEC